MILPFIQLSNALSCFDAFLILVDVNRACSSFNEMMLDLVMVLKDPRNELCGSTIMSLWYDDNHSFQTPHHWSLGNTLQGDLEMVMVMVMVCFSPTRCVKIVKTLNGTH